MPQQQPSKHPSPDGIVDRLTALVYEINLLLKAAPGVHVKVDVDTIDHEKHTEIVLTIGKR